MGNSIDLNQKLSGSLLFLVGEGLPARISQRPALKIMKAARCLDLSPTKCRDAKLYSSARAQSTTSVHSQVVEVFLAYLRKRNLPPTTFRERILQDFVHHLEDIRKPYSFLKQVGHVFIDNGYSIRMSVRNRQIILFKIQTEAPSLFECARTCFVRIFMYSQ
jgi:hypothetical protein